MPIIYKTTCLINGKIYIGQSKYNNKYYLGSGKILLKALSKYGRQNFIKEILEECSHEELNYLEIKYINEYNSTDKNIGYNLEKGGCGNTEKQNENISKMNQNRIVTEETKNKIRIKKLGKPLSEETRKKMSISKIGNKLRLGKSHTDFDKIKISESIKKYYEIEENRIKSKNAARKRISEGKCLEGVRIISSKENQIRATELARLSNSKKVIIKDLINDLEFEFNSLNECRIYFKIKSNGQLIYCIKNNKVYRKRYIILYKNKPS